jgi:hypothetical protein
MLEPRTWETDQGGRQHYAKPSRTRRASAESLVDSHQGCTLGTALAGWVVLRKTKKVRRELARIGMRVSFMPCHAMQDSWHGRHIFVVRARERPIRTQLGLEGLGMIGHSEMACMLQRESIGTGAKGCYVQATHPARYGTVRSGR